MDRFNTDPALIHDWMKGKAPLFVIVFAYNSEMDPAYGHREAHGLAGPDLKDAALRTTSRSSRNTAGTESFRTSTSSPPTSSQGKTSTDGAPSTSSAPSRSSHESPAGTVRRNN